ncbi:MAG: isopentenyl-diphosphate Delta-isomerase [Nanoarchaeota archaeon]|nr:isopentenyl-diphosphate Delta-isomerase [Nanoarchaeota archaeon]
MEEIILVDENDNEIGFMEKLEAHQDGGRLHRCFSIFVFNSEGKMLLQKRAKVKYHFGELWANTCCSHPNKGEETDVAVHRKLMQEFGFDTELKEVFTFIYKAYDAGSQLTEHEFDHVFIGTFDGEPKPNPEEIGEYDWVEINWLKKDVQENPSKYSPWFKIALDKVLKHLEK